MFLKTIDEEIGSKASFDYITMRELQEKTDEILQNSSIKVSVN